MKDVIIVGETDIHKDRVGLLAHALANRRAKAVAVPLRPVYLVGKDNAIE